MYSKQNIKWSVFPSKHGRLHPLVSSISSSKSPPHAAATLPRTMSFRSEGTSCGTKNVQGKHQLMWRNTSFNVMIFWPRIPTIYCILTMPMFVLFFQATASKTPYCQRLHPCLVWDSRIWSWPDLMNIFSMFLAILSQNTFSDVQGDFQSIEWHNLEQHKRWAKKCVEKQPSTD